MKNTEMVGKWIWYPDDFEIELSARIMMTRYERDVPVPPFWKQYSCWRNVKFVKRVALSLPEIMKVTAEGVYNVAIDGAYVYEHRGIVQIPSGKHEIVISVAAEKGLPALKVDGAHTRSDGSWLVTCNDHRYLPAAYNDALVHGESTPNNVRLATEICTPVRICNRGNITVYDFGRQLFAKVELIGTKPASGAIRIYYGESEEEAFDQTGCELLSDVTAQEGAARTENAMAFRYLSAIGATFSSVRAVNEYLPQPRKSTFRSSEPLLDEIYGTAQYTLSLTTREFILDGIKRDRWIWSGDAYQGYLMNYYCFFDCDVVKRTMLALFGKEPFDLHLNHIMDYTFFWIMGFCDYYRYTHDRAFIENNFSKAVSALEYCISRTDENGLMKGLDGDWVFIDWAENLDNTGEVSFEQMLYCISLDCMAKLARDFDHETQAARYAALHREVFAKLEDFWSEEKGAYVHSVKDGKPDGKIFRYANIFAVIYDLCSSKRQKLIAETVLKSAEVQAITTPYMRFYELAALMKVGEKAYVLDEIKSYWGGMLDEGANTFWETYDKTQKGDEKYAMYGRRFGKSLCHTWGASPLYLLGKYVVGLEPAENGKYIVRPDKATLAWFEAKIPFGEGEVFVAVNEDGVRVYGNAASGTLVWQGKEYAVKAGEELFVPTGEMKNAI